MFIEKPLEKDNESGGFTYHRSSDRGSDGKAPDESPAPEVPAAGRTKHLAPSHEASKEHEDIVKKHSLIRQSSVGANVW